MATIWRPEEEKHRRGTQEIFQGHKRQRTEVLAGFCKKMEAELVSLIRTCIGKDAMMLLEPIYGRKTNPRRPDACNRRISPC